MQYRQSLLDRMERTLWIVLLLLVPISASPLLPIGSGTLVRPLSFIPALLLLGAAIFRVVVLRQRTHLPRDSLWLLAIFGVYVLVGGLAVLLDEPDRVFKGQTPQDSFVRALLTLGVGFIFYVVARLHMRKLDDLRLSLRWLFIGLSASIGLAVIQFVAIVEGGNVLRDVQAVTDLFAVRTSGLANRAQGMSLEPSWLASQVLLLMLPALVAQLLSRQLAPGTHPGRSARTRALVGLAIALTGLVCAGSRFGLVGAALILLLAGAMAMWSGRFIVALVVSTVLMAAGGGIALVSTLGAGAGSGYVLNPVNVITTQIQNAGDDNGTTLADLLSIGGRVAANQAALDIWLDHPLTGVSLGNNFRYFGRYAPDWAYTAGFFTSGIMEGAAWVDPSAPEKANAKNMVLRLLSETGIIGLGIFLIFVWRQIYASRGRDPYFLYFRTAAAAALIFSFFNQDSFADPAIWLVLVLCNSMGRLQENSDATAAIALGHGLAAAPI